MKIAIIGSGPSGLIAAKTLSKLGKEISLFGPLPDEVMLKRDTRTAALMMNSIYLLHHIGAWSRCAPYAEPLRALRLIDNCNRIFTAPECHFTADEVNLRAFGYNIRQQDLNKVLIKLVQKDPLISWHTDGLVKNIVCHDNFSVIETEKGKNFSFDLVVGADGRQSICRNAADIKEYTHNYQQSAIACTFTHELDHQQTSVEFHRPDGPLTFVPMQGKQSSLVWSHKPDDALHIIEMDDQSFSDELYKQSHGIFGQILTVGPRASFPIGVLGVQQFAKHNIALVGEAAHVLPPIGAQGLNLGIRDIALLYDCLNDETDLEEQLIQYNKTRRSDVWSRTLIADLLNRSLVSTFLPLTVLRNFGLRALNSISSFRTMFINEGLKPAHLSPSLMVPSLENEQVVDHEDRDGSSSQIRSNSGNNVQNKNDTTCYSPEM